MEYKKDGKAQCTRFSNYSTIRIKKHMLEHHVKVETKHRQQHKSMIHKIGRHRKDIFFAAYLKCVFCFKEKLRRN